MLNNANSRCKASYQIYHYQSKCLYIDILLDKILFLRVTNAGAYIYEYHKRQSNVCYQIINTITDK